MHAVEITNAEKAVAVDCCLLLLKPCSFSSLSLLLPKLVVLGKDYDVFE